MSIDVNVQNDLVIVTESSEDITVNVSNAAGPAGVGVPTGGSAGEVLKKLSGTDYDTYWALDGGGVPYSGATGNVDLGEYELKAGQVEFDQTPTGTAGVGVMRWNDSDGTVDLGLKGGNVTLQVGQEQVLRVVNKTGADLLESQYRAVRIRLVSEGGSQGQRLAVVLAQGDNDPDSTTTIGIVTETILNNQEGFITTSGEVRGINTTGSLQGETWLDGDIIYLSPTVPGGITKVKPTAPQHLLQLGYVIYAHNVNGKIFVKIDNGYELGELHDVYVPSPSNNDGIFWNTANSRYQNNSITGVLGYTPVPTTRTITINGTTLDLSADRTYTVSASATPAGSNTQIQYNNSGVFGGSAGLVYNDSTGVMTLSKNLNIGTINQSTTYNQSNYLFIGYGNINSSNYTSPDFSLSQNVYYNGTNNIYAINGFSNTFYLSNLGNFQFFTSPSGVANATATLTERMRLTNAGRLLLGTTTESTFLLDVNGTARIGSNLVVTDSISGSNTFILRYDTTTSCGTIEASTTGIAYRNLILNPANSSNVGIGIVPTRKLDVNGTSRYLGEIFVNADSGSTTTQLLYLKNSSLNSTSTVSQLTLFRDGASGIAYGGMVRFNQKAYSNPISASFTQLDISMSDGTTESPDTTPLSIRGTGIGINNTSPNTSAMLDVTSTTKGFLMPRMTTTQRDAIATPATGLQIYNTTTNENNTYNGTAWVAAGGGGGSMAIGGSITSATAGSVLFAGTSGVLAQNNASFFWDNANNRLGIGTNTPTTTLDIIGISKFRNGVQVQGSLGGTLTGAGFELEYGGGVAYVTAYNRTLPSWLPMVIRASQIDLTTDGSVRGRFTTAGRLLLGTTTESTFLLDVNGTARVSGAITQTMGATNINLLTSGSGTTSDRCFLIGNGTVTGNYNITIGHSATTSGPGSLNIGFGNNVSSSGLCLSSSGAGYTVAGGIGINGNVTNGGIGIGGSVTNGITIHGTQTGTSNIAIGFQSVGSGAFSIAMGYIASTGGFSQSIALGIFSLNTANNQLVIGGGDNSTGNYGVSDVYIGNGVQSRINTGAGLNVSLNGSGGSGTNGIGANITIAGGKGTGSGTSGDVVISTATTTTSGTTLQTLTQRLRIKGTQGSVRFIPIATPSSAEAGDVYYDSTSNKLRCYNGTTWNDLF